MFSRFHGVKKSLSVLALLAAIAVAPVGATEHTIDLSHSYILFTVEHLGMGVSYGRFNEFEGKVNFDEGNPTGASFDVTIKAASIDTGNERRDKHLRSPDFFNANQFAEVTFKSSKVEKKGGRLHVHGEMTLMGITKPLVLDLELTGSGTHPRSGKALKAFHGKGTFKRSDFGMTYGLDNGALGDEIELIISLEILG